MSRDTFTKMIGREITSLPITGQSAIICFRPGILPGKPEHQLSWVTIYSNSLA